MQTESLQAGSIIVRLRITVQDPEFSVDASTFAPVLSYLHNGSALLVDQQNTVVEGKFYFLLFFFPNKKTGFVFWSRTVIASILHKKYFIERQSMWFFGGKTMTWEVLHGLLSISPEGVGQWSVGCSQVSAGIGPLCLRMSAALGFPINFPPCPLCEQLEVCCVFLTLKCR